MLCVLLHIDAFTFIVGVQKRHPDTLKRRENIAVDSGHLLFLCDDIFKPWHDLFICERAKAKPHAARLEGRDDLGQVVADDAEPGVFCELLNHWKITNIMSLFEA